MYLVDVEIKPSDIEGRGVFIARPIERGAVVWKYEPEYDKILSRENFEKLSKEEKEEIEKVGYISPSSGMWVYPPKEDPARFTNHSLKQNNLSVAFDTTVSSEPFFIANRNINAGEELSVNYTEFDERIQESKPPWI